MRARIPLSSLVTALLLALCLALPASAAEPQEPMGDLVFTMSTDDTAVFDAALLMGNVAMKRGHKVVMILRVDAIKVALAANTYPVDDTTLAARLTAFMNSGATVMAGGGCMKKMGLAPAALIPGVQVGKPDSVMGAIFKEGARVISY